MILGPEQSSAPLYRRSAFQISLLHIATLGLYSFYWAYRVRRWCEITLELPNSSLLKTIALIVPIFNLFMLFDLGMQIKGAAHRARTRADERLPLLGVASFVMIVVGRAPAPFGLLALLSFVPIAGLHLPFERAQAAIHGEIGLPRKFNWFEWFVLAIGVVMLTLIAMRRASIMTVAVYAAAAFALVLIKKSSDRITSSDRIAADG